MKRSIPSPLISLPYVAVSLALSLTTQLVKAESAIAENTTALAADTKSPAAATPSVKAEVQKTIDQVVAIVRDFPGNSNKSLRHIKMREAIKPRFDFDEMSRASLGANWKVVTPEQREEFVTLFSELLARTYLSRIDSITPNMVRVAQEKVKLPRAYLETIVKKDGDTFSIDYWLNLKDNQWRVYDVVIENISLVQNYRNEFAAIIRKDKMTGLLNQLRNKVKTTEDVKV